VRPATHEEIDAELCRRSLAEFIRQAWHVLEPGPLVWGWHLDAMCEHLEAQTRGEIRDLIINVPPRSSKSTVASIMWPAWEWTWAAHRRFVCSSYSESLSLDLALQHRRLVESEWFRARFPNVELAPDAQAKHKFDTTALGFRISTSTGGTITGKGGDRILADDPHNTKKAESEADRKTVIEHWRKTLSNRGNDAKKVTRTIIMQRVHERDLSGELLADGNWEHLCIPQEFEVARRCRTSIGWTDPRTAEGELLQPDRMGPEEVEKAKIDLTPYGYAGQHQQRPAPAEGGIFKRAWWRFWRYSWEEPIAELASRTVVVEQDVRWEMQVLSWDMAFAKTDTSSFVCGGAWGRKGSGFYLLDLTWERMDFVRTCQEFKAQTVKFPNAVAKLIEKKANGPAVINTFEQTIAGIIPIEPEGGKEARAYATSPFVYAGNVYLPLHARWRDRYIEEHASFPNGANNDAVDQQSQVLNWFQANGVPSYNLPTGKTRPELRRRI
jgi:predicted phage terminase large subunit-like protein